MNYLPAFHSVFSRQDGYVSSAYPKISNKAAISCLTYHLKTVEIKNFGGHGNQLDIVRFLLRKDVYCREWVLDGWQTLRIEGRSSQGQWSFRDHPHVLCWNSWILCKFMIVQIIYLMMSEKTKNMYVFSLKYLSLCSNWIVFWICRNWKQCQSQWQPYVLFETIKKLLNCFIAQFCSS